MPKFQIPMFNSQAIVRVSGGLIRVDTHRGNEEIFLNRHSQGTNSQTITQVKTRLPREKPIHIFFCFFSFSLILVSIESNNILITIGMRNVFSFLVRAVKFVVAYNSFFIL